MTAIAIAIRQSNEKVLDERSDEDRERTDRLKLPDPIQSPRVEPFRDG
jgi:hypothetical protein